MRRRFPAFLFAVTALSGGVLAGRPTAFPPQTAGAHTRCTALAGFQDMRIVSASPQGASLASTTTPALPAHCEIVGEIAPRTGADAQHYAIRFHLRLPDAWNHRFFFQGGGGSNGVLGDALGNLQGGQPDFALMRGFAVVSQDSGHDNLTNDVPAHGGTASFGWDPEARRNYAFASQARVTEVAKALVATFYGEAPRFSYWVGCSKGGQEGMAMAERYPDYFNGIMANAPGFALPKAAIAQAWDTQAFARAATALGLRTASGQPLLNASFSNADLGLVSGAVTKACDRLDGVADGIVANGAMCTTSRVKPYLDALQCRAGKADTCLAAPQLTAIRTVIAGPRDRTGAPLYSDWAWDPGIGGTIAGKAYEGWRGWKLGSAGGAENDSRNVLLGGASLASVFLAPPRAILGDADALMRFQTAFDFDSDARAIFASIPAFPSSPWELMGAQSADRTAFKRAGGKMIVMHGVADPVFSFRDTARWWDRLNDAEHGHAAEFTRVFAVPGMNHCRGGPATSDFDAFDALVEWVEKGEAPNQITARAPRDTPWPGRTRPLCPYPQFARYRGTGDIEKAENFRCVPGQRLPLSGVTKAR